MRFMTFNLRFENNADKENGWDCRRRQVADLILRHAPSVLGAQEGTPRQLRYLRENLPGYGMYVPAERVWDETCQYPTLFYRSDEIRIVEGGEFWLSTTPSVHRSKDWDSAYPRIMCHALCEPVGPDPPFWALVTHLDNLGTEARVRQGGLIGEWIGNHPEPIVLTGDFNDKPGSPVHRLLTSPELGLRDSWEVLGRAEGTESMTHHGFSGVPGIYRMDWILLSDRFHVLDALVIRDHNKGRYPSDHFPYLISCTYA